MAVHRSTLPRRVTQAYWVRVREILRGEHGLSQTEATKAVEAFQAMLGRAGIQDGVYHAPVDETATGIVQGGYAGKPGRPTPADQNGRQSGRRGAKTTAR